MIRVTQLFLLCGLLVLGACGTSDHETLLGKWQCEQDWFQFYNDSTYDGGKAIITLLKKARYTLDEEQHTLTLYTDNEKSTFYLDYEFRGKDTLLLHNKLNAEHIQAIYVRQSTTTKQE